MQRLLWACGLAMTLGLAAPALALDRPPARPNLGTLDINVDDEPSAFAAAEAWLRQHVPQATDEPIVRHQPLDLEAPVEWVVAVPASQRNDAIMFFESLHAEQNLEAPGEPPATGWQPIHVQFISPRRRNE